MLLDAISEIKGLFTRRWKQDQWDWFTVSAQLGHPSAQISKVISFTLSDWRKDIQSGIEPLKSEHGARLLALPFRKCLYVLIGRHRIADEPGAGWIYYLSTREQPSIAKIGRTTRTLEERIREINGATGVLTPYGVRSCWRVSDPEMAERLIHNDLATYRIRADREFFRLPYGPATKRIGEVLAHHGLEIRTLNALTSLE